MPETPKEYDINSNEGAKTDRVNQQCFLVDNYQKFAFRRNSYKKLTCMMGDPSDVLQALSARPGQTALLSMSNDKFAQLQPMIRFFKIPMNPYTKDLDTKRKKQEIVFSTTMGDLFVNRNSAVWGGGPHAGAGGYRGDQVGLKEISYELMESGGGSTVGKQQEVTVKFIADSMQALERQGILDLVIFPKNRTSDYNSSGKEIKGSARANLDYYAIQVVFGWALPQNVRETLGGLSPAERQAVKQSTVTLTLNLKGHDISFQEDGSIEVTAEYMGYVDTRMADTSADILAPTSAEKRQREVRAKLLFEREMDVRRAELHNKEQKEKLAALKARGATEKQKAHNAAKFRAKWKLKEGEKLTAEEHAAYYGKDNSYDKEYDQTRVQMKNAEANLKNKKKEKQGWDDYVENLEAEEKQRKYSRLLLGLQKSGNIWSVDIKAGDLARMGKKIRKRRIQSKINKEEYDKLSDKDKGLYDLNRATQAKTTMSKPTKAGPKNNVINKAIQAGKEHTAQQSKDKAYQRKKENRKEKKGMNNAVARGIEDGIAESESAKEKAKDFHRGNSAKAWSDGSHIRVYYMYWGDLLSTALDYAYGPISKKLPIRYLVGTINFTNPRSGKVDTINLADIPISLNLFTSWWFDKVIAPQADSYTVKSFVRDSINELILAALGDGCYDGGPNFGPVGGDSSRNALAPPRIEFTTISAPLGQGQKERIPNKGRVGLNHDSIIQYRKGRAKGTNWAIPDNHVEYIYIYCNAWTKKQQKGNYAEDQKNGIYHLSVGQDSGPVKKIDFKKDEEMSEYLATDAMLQEQSMDQLVAHYDAEVEMMGNTIFMPSNYVYIAPTALGVSSNFAMRMGLGGYYTVTGINGKVSNTGWTTTMKCKHNFKTKTEKGGGKAAGNSKPGPTRSNDPTKAKK